MKETLICSLNKHHIYYLSNCNYGFYIFVPFKDYTDTNITIRLKSNYQNYDLNKNSIDGVINELINYYKNLDDYNITLILPVFYDDILTRVGTVNDMEIYQKLERYLGEMFNSSYDILVKNNIKVNNSIYVINNDSFKVFTSWFVSRYNNRIEYKTLIELIKRDDNFNNYNVIETPRINFVVSKNEEPSIEETKEIVLDTFDSIASEEMNNTTMDSTKKSGNSGYVSYVLLGVITIVIALVAVIVFMK